MICLRSHCGEVMELTPGLSLFWALLPALLCLMVANPPTEAVSTRNHMSGSTDVWPHVNVAAEDYGLPGSICSLWGED